MRRFAFVVLSFAAVAVSSGVSAQTAEDCYQATLRQDDHEIIRICSQALQKGGMSDENRSIVTSNRGLGYLRDKQFDKAILDFSDALVINPKNPYSFNFRGDAWREKGNLDRAFADFDQALRIDPAFTGAIYNRGLTFEKQGDASSARAEYRKAVATRGNSALDQWARDRARERLAALGEGSQQPKREYEPLDGGRGNGGRER
jgi:lipoprotein NlpI